MEEKAPINASLHGDVELHVDDLEESNYNAYTYDYCKKAKKGDGRIEIRNCWTQQRPKR